VNLLAIDTTLAACSVAVLAGDAAPVILSEVIGRGHAERLAPMAAEAMARAGLAFADLDRVGVTVGPGSFTGVRIGVAFARGLGLVTGAETVSVGVLAALAARARELAGPVPVLALLDARRGELYAQAFAGDGTERDAPRVATAAALASSFRGDMRLAGSGAEAVAAILPDRLAGLIVHQDTHADIATVLHLCRTAAPTVLRPLYLRPPDAKSQGAGLPRR
jgi:tRNA threonylcarbamoyladenosine biosynthesis protein TsaB